MGRSEEVHRRSAGSVNSFTSSCRAVVLLPNIYQLTQKSAMVDAIVSYYEEFLQQ